VVPARAGATNDVAISEVATAFSVSSPATSTRLLTYLALLAQSQKKSNEGSRGMLNAKAQGSHDIPNTRSLAQQPALQLNSAVLTGNKSTEGNLNPAFVLKRVRILANVESCAIAVAHQSSIRH